MLSNTNLNQVPIALPGGPISTMHVGFKGTMNAIFLQDSAAKRVGDCAGQVEAGKSGGGRCFGYRVVVGGDGQRGERVIDEAEAAIVRRIFREFVAGVSPRTIAKALNVEGIPGSGHGEMLRGRRHGVLARSMATLAAARAS